MLNIPLCLVRNFNMSPSHLPRLIVLLAVFSTDAAADWQYTRWGMTKDEAIDASRGALRETNANGISLLTGTYTTGEHEYSTSLHFDKAGHLSAVLLVQHTISECRSTARALQDKYGAGEPSSRSNSALVYRDPGANNLIEFDDLSTNSYAMNISRPPLACSVEYRSLSSAGDNGM